MDEGAVDYHLMKLTEDETVTDPLERLATAPPDDGAGVGNFMDMASGRGVPQGQDEAAMA